MSAPSYATWLRLTQTSAPATTILIRFYIGLIFLCEGILKFLSPETLGPGRFDKAGIPAAVFLANLDGVLEIGCGILLLAGFATRLAAVPMIINMAGALLITKAPILWSDSALFPKPPGGGASSTNPAPTWPNFAAPSSCSLSGRAPTRSTPPSTAAQLPRSHSESYWI